MTTFRKHAMVQKRITKLEGLVAKGAITPGYAADILLADFMRSMSDEVEDTNNNHTHHHATDWLHLSHDSEVEENGP